MSGTTGRVNGDRLGGGVPRSVPAAGGPVAAVCGSRPEAEEAVQEAFVRALGLTVAELPVIAAIGRANLDLNQDGPRFFVAFDVGHALFVGTDVAGTTNVYVTVDNATSWQTHPCSVCPEWTVHSGCCPDRQRPATLSRVTRRRIVVLASVAVVAAVALAISLATAAHATALRQTYLQLNLCGNACNNGTLAVITQLEHTIDARQPFAITLNELCENQYDRLTADLGAYHGRFDPTGPTCVNGARYGNAILLHTTEVTLIGSWQLPNPAADETRRLMCLGTRLPDGPALTVCGTHISSFVANGPPQISAVAAILRGLPGHDPLVLAGDFNTVPANPGLDPLYRTCYAGGTGQFDEAASTGCARTETGDEHTWQQHKYDYVFLSGGGFTAVEADASDAVNGLSDHRALWATATVVSSSRPG